MGVGRPPSAGDHLRTMLDHHNWATLLLIDRCLELSPGQLGLSTPGTFGSIHATLDHIVWADRDYLRLITDGGEEEPPSEVPPPVLTLRADMERQARRWRDLLERVDELDATLPPDEGDPPYPEIEHAVGLFLAQAVHHGNEHRAHVCSVLGAHGLEVPDLSAWEYVRLLQVWDSESPFDQKLAERVRVVLAGVPDLDERLMFGGIAFMVGGHMACGVVGHDLMVRLGPEAAEQALREPHVRPMDFTGRPSRGMVYVGADGLRGQRDLQRWVRVATAFVGTLPARRSC